MVFKCLGAMNRRVCNDYERRGELPCTEAPSAYVEGRVVLDPCQVTGIGTLGDHVEYLARVVARRGRLVHAICMSQCH